MRYGCFAVLCCGAALAATNTHGGALEGVQLARGITAFKGIPFAAPPVGELRWHAPKPAVPWDGVRKADRFSDSCVQSLAAERKPWTYEFMTHNSISEDCLYLNVWTGAKTDEKLPVFVWIYGGGYVEGSTAVPVYDGENLARRGVVVVTINYRLGVMGFLAHPELTKESGHQSSGNYGLLDQIAALEWVKRNIAGFGGDPARVTIAGQSAGAGSVHNLIASPLAKELFHRAIAESGSSITPNARMLQLKEAEEAGMKFAESKNARSLLALRAMQWQDVVLEPGGVTRRPIVDGWVVPAAPNEIVGAGKHHDVPVLTGLTADEGSSSPEYGKVPVEKWKQRFGPLSEEFLKLYPADDAVNSQKQSARDMGLVSMYLWAAHRAKTSKTAVYTYFWTHAEPGPDSERYGAFHTSEVPYVFNTLEQSKRPWTADDKRIAERVGSYWVNFISTGDPNGKGLPQWPAFSVKETVTMELGDQFRVRAVADAARIEFFRRHFAAQRQ